MTLWIGKRSSILNIEPSEQVGSAEAERHPNPHAAHLLRGLYDFKAADMAYKYWIKLYHEILDDPKMGAMSDRLWRRTVEIFLLAGDFGEDGLLPPLRDIAWRLRISEETAESDLVELAKEGIVAQIEGQWIVEKFRERQSPMSPAEKMRRKREEEKAEEWYVTESNEPSNTDKIRIDKNREDKIIIDAVVAAFSEFGMNIKKIRELIDNYDPYYLKEKIREYNFKRKQIPSTTVGWLIRSIEEEWASPKDYVPDTDNPWVREKKMAGWKPYTE